MTNQQNAEQIGFGEVQIENETYLCISNVDKMRPFFMSIVSDSNHWMFIGSNGGLSAGRKDVENSLFPYYTDDKIIESAEITGSKSIFLVEKDGKTLTWEPFSIRYASIFNISRNLYKNKYGNKILFEEINHDLNLTFQYQWNSSNAYGFVKKSKLINTSSATVQVNMLDGIQNILPYGVESGTQVRSSNLVDAYKRSELDKASGLGIFALSAIIVDKAEPSEALKANVAWSHGLENPTYLLSSLQLGNFRQGISLSEEVDVKAEKGAYFISKEIELANNEAKEWMIVANVNQTIASIVRISKEIQENAKIAQEVSQDIELGTERLIKLNASADALQLSNDCLRDNRHFANSLFNIMRGGVFDNNYLIEKKDFSDYLGKANKEVATAFKKEIEMLPETFTLSEILTIATTSGNNNFKRLCFEYMPLKFSRRHGDPSRPWNQFSINTHDENDGSKILDYQGNWRDIFQNWEALAHSFPEFIEGMIFRFLNASTFDGYNPYRITKNGIDWERIEPDDPWSYIGYWGDHQIIYLQKFLEFAESRYPGKLESYFNENIFVYANVPYKIKSYEEQLVNPKDTIDFDHSVDNAISEKWRQLGADSALLANQQGSIVHVNFAEKLLASLLAKMSNFIPEGGIWMNTQRPEWNDANNALVGNGVSMVTLYYMIRFLKFTHSLFEKANAKSVSLSKELKDFYQKVNVVLVQHRDSLSSNFDDKTRKLVLDELGKAGSNYRLQIYAKSFTGEKEDLSVTELVYFFELCLQYLEHSLKANKRADNLYHAYNLMTVTNDEEVSISYLSEMLEGQVAVLSSGQISSEEALAVLDALKSSKLFREDQYSYLLYPEKELDGFLKKNTIPSSAVEQSELLGQLVAQGNLQLIEKDVRGNYHFNGNFRNAKDVAAKLDQLEQGAHAKLVQAERKQILQLFEDVFNHKAFTGRSGTFYGYEGLGSIYWHMVSKLAVAVQECCIRAIEEKESEEVIGKLLEHYYEIVAGIGNHKPPKLYGAFPTDPYSHTPRGKGAQQPGMTGQVKEDILCRFAELGIVVNEGKLAFKPYMLKKDEFLENASVFCYITSSFDKAEIKARKNSLCFTYCQVPIIYQIAKESSLQVAFKNGTTQTWEGTSLDAETSNKIFERSGEVISVTVHIEESILK